MIIYKWTNKINGKVYIGQTSKGLAHRIRAHVNTTNVGSGLPIHNAIRKYGLDNFIIVELASASSIEELNALEIKLIQEHDSLVPRGYNLKFGGDNHNWHPESRAKASKGAKQRVANDNGRQIGAALKLARKALKGVPPWNKGKRATPEAISNQSRAHIGQKAWNKGKSISEDARQRLMIAAAKRSKPVQCLESGQEWLSLEACSREVGISPIHIKRLIKSGRKSVKTGLSFKFSNTNKD